MYENELTTENYINYSELTEKREQRVDELAGEVLTLSRNALLMNLRFMDAALNQFRLIKFENSLATDGHDLYYEPYFVLNCYKEEKESVTHAYLHILLHCVYRHMYIHHEIDVVYWDLACDIAAEYTIYELGLKDAETKRMKQQRPIFELLKEKLNILTAEKIYRYYLEQNLIPEALRSMRMLFQVDDHYLWYPDNDEEPEKVSNKRTNKSSSNQMDIDTDEPDPSPRDEDQGKQDEQQEEIWKNISRRMQTDLETFSKKRGKKASNLVQTLDAINREHYDYSRFLQKFASAGEIMKVNDNDFDLIFYTYGLKLYKNLPLIEPLEYKEVKRIKEFVIAIDTSYSVSGKLVQAFVQKTYNILKTSESFYNTINLHIIQCDAEVQEDVKITSQREFDRYLQTMKIHGLGGTDFRPVFEHVDDLIRRKEFTNLKGMIYFTDGHGMYPNKRPQYDTAFIFVDKDGRRPDVPPWAMRVILDEDDLKDQFLPGKEPVFVNSSL